MKNNPLEEVEAMILAGWLSLKKYTFTHIANESWQRSSPNIIQMMIKKKKMGVSKWVPDFIIILKRWSLLFIELKRLKWSIVSKEQKSWIEKLSQIENIEARVVYWSQEAIQLIQELEDF